jgi:error-prone DNA polymerase
VSTQSYAPLWCKSNFSFLEGASRPEELVAEAHAYGLSHIAITDRDGVYGVVAAFLEAQRLGIRLIVGSEITVDDGSRVVLLARNRDGYRNLTRLITTGRMRNPKGTSEVSWNELAAHAGGTTAVWVRGFSGHPHGAAVLADAFGEQASIAVSRHHLPEDGVREMRARELAGHYGLGLVAAPEVLYHHPERRMLQDTLTSIRFGCSLEEAGTRLRPNAEFALKSPAAMAILYRDAPELLEAGREIAASCSFSLSEIEYRYPSEALPSGYTTSGRLRELTYRGARERYAGEIPADVHAQLERELSIIDELDYCGYFLTMWEIVDYCRRKGILCQGRGSAANSAVCYCLGITAIDPVRMNLLFERFISKERAEPPDIDLDIEHRRREEVIQHVYEKYGRSHAAMVANVIRYRLRSAVRDVGTALGISEVSLDRLAKLVSHREDNLESAVDQSGIDEESRLSHVFRRLVREILDFPRHLSIHPGGFLLGNEPVHDIVPVENATMEDRTVIQWDKRDVEAMNLFKVDLLGLGALTHLDYAFRLIRKHTGATFSMATIPAADRAVFDMISRADTVGVFQLESRAQMAMLPRLKPREFYDLVIEVSIVRPGPITGGMVHPYLRRRAGEEAVEYPHPRLEPVLKKTLGVPLFQEQVMRLAVIAADYTPGEADQLRRDMAAWRKSGRIEKHREKLTARMTQKGITEEFAERVFDQIRGFGEYGFPESHAASFAFIAWCTAWVKRHYPAVFACALLNAWPMGFYAPSTIVEDARRHGVEVLPVSVLESSWECTLVPAAPGAPGGAEHPGRGDATDRRGSTTGPGRRDRRWAVRMGLRYVKGLGAGDWTRISAAREARPGTIDDFLRAARLSEDVKQNLAQAGAFACFGVDRRGALWRAATRGTAGGEQDWVRLLDTAVPAPSFPALSAYETIAWDYGFSYHSTTGHPMEPHRRELAGRGLPTARELGELLDGRFASYAGLVICRQRPETAGGTLFMTLEDETGFVNLVVWKDVYERYRTRILTSAVLGVTGKLQSREGLVHVVVREIWTPQLSRRPTEVQSRDFH